MKEDPGYFGADSDDDGGFRYPAAKTTKLRARQHPWARVARRFSRAATKRLSEDPPDEPPSERVWDVPENDGRSSSGAETGQRGRRGHEEMGVGL